jgi:hypothetical protein
MTSAGEAHAVMPIAERENAAERGVRAEPRPPK